MKKWLFCVLYILTIFSCVRHPTTSFENPKKVEELLSKIIEYGDTTAYFEISVDYFIENKDKEFLYYALMMANKYNNSQACNDVYNILTRFQNYNLNSLDNKTKNMALYYLVKSYELAPDNMVKFDIKDVFGQDSIPNSSYYLEEMQK